MQNKEARDGKQGGPTLKTEERGGVTLENKGPTMENKGAAAAYGKHGARHGNQIGPTLNKKGAQGRFAVFEADGHEK